MHRLSTLSSIPHVGEHSLKKRKCLKTQGKLWVKAVLPEELGESGGGMPLITEYAVHGALV